MGLVELELGILVPGPLGLPKCGKLELGTLPPKSAELVSECLWLPKCVELELGMLVELEAGILAPELFGLPKYFKLEVGTPFSGLIRDTESEPEIPVAELLRLSNCPEVKPGTSFSGLI